MLISEMEAELKSLNQRVGRIEQILPTLATKADLERFATKADLERLATKDELRAEVRGVRVLIEEVRNDVKIVHERIDIETAGLSRRMDDRFQQLQQQMHSMQQQVSEVLRRLDRP